MIGMGLLALGGATVSYFKFEIVSQHELFDVCSDFFMKELPWLINKGC